MHGKQDRQKDWFMFYKAPPEGGWVVSRLTWTPGEARSPARTTATVQGRDDDTALVMEVQVEVSNI